MNTEVPVQIDGEPWLQSPCAITILKSALKVKKAFFLPLIGGSLFVMKFFLITQLGNNVKKK